MTWLLGGFGRCNYAFRALRPTFSAKGVSALLATAMRMEGYWPWSEWSADHGLPPPLFSLGIQSPKRNARYLGSKKPFSVSVIGSLGKIMVDPMTGWLKPLGFNNGGYIFPPIRFNGGWNPRVFSVGDTKGEVICGFFTQQWSWANYYISIGFHRLPSTKREQVWLDLKNLSKRIQRAFLEAVWKTRV